MPDNTARKMSLTRADEAAAKPAKPAKKKLPIKQITVTATETTEIKRDEPAPVVPTPTPEPTTPEPAAGRISTAIEVPQLVWMKDKTFTYLEVKRTDDEVTFLRLEKGIVELVELPLNHGIVLGLLPYTKRSLRESAEVYVRSKLNKTPEASRVIQAILDNRDVGRRDFVTDVADKDDAPTPAAKTPRKAAKRADKAGTTRPSRDGMVTAVQIADELGMDPRDMRARIRKAGWVKPDQGWAWPAAQHDEMKAKLAALKK